VHALGDVGRDFIHQVAAQDRIGSAQASYRVGGEVRSTAVAR
jgi:hypothetical protein